jgi:hypothetical protein
MPKYYCPYCPDLISCIHDNKYVVDEPESEFELFNIKSSTKRRNSDENKSLLDESEPMIISELLNISSTKRKNSDDNPNILIEDSIKDITYKLKKIKVTKKISYKRKPDEIIDTNYNKKIKVIS